ncbi:HEAT repeat domain-containing protein [Pararhodospirillum oryzae]|uniref:PBS lyase n=1 Tax=Pararhodospirillum oryzae TaxID=478448 RepID=A0A512HC34_9PROT|nr:hypothetical protein [Pararhodospirillum oryzae]GEO82999.1 PBS lyase [Pararhodospirillum oryzae]
MALMKTDPLAPGAFSDLAAVAGGLWDPLTEGRCAAARAAVDFPDSVPLLVARLRVETDPKVFGTLESALVSIGSDAVVMGVVPLLRAPKPAVRIVGTDILRALGGRSEPVVRALLTDDDPALRMIGVTIARTLPNPDAPSWSLDMLRRESHPGVCMAALDSLAQSRPAGLRPPGLAPVLLDLKTRFPEADDIAASVDQLLRLEGLPAPRAP